MCRRAAATRPPAHWQEVEDSRREEVGWAGHLGRQVAAQVKLSLCFSLLVSVFYSFDFVLI